MTANWSMYRMVRVFALLAVTVVPITAKAECVEPAYKLVRYDEDYRYLRDPACRIDFWDPIKYIPLGRNPETYLSLGGELRERGEYFAVPVFGLVGSDGDGYLLHRLLLSGDLHFTNYFRWFVQFGSELQAGKDDTILSPIDLDRLDVQQAFMDILLPFAAEIEPTFRAGRQEINFGSQRLVSVRESPNVRRSFDGFRLFNVTEGIRLDAFATRPVLVKSGKFDDWTNQQQGFWGLYGTGAVLPGLDADLYYLGFSNEQARFGNVTDREFRHSLGTRIFGDAAGWDWNFESLGQFGSFGTQGIKAWTVASDTGYSLNGLSWKPRLGLKANIASGDHNARDGKLGTFNPLFPKLDYFSEAALIAPSNFFDFQPSITLHPAQDLSVAFAWDILWRETTRDAIYTSPFTPIRGTAGHEGLFTGNMLSIDVDWHLSRHVEIKASYVFFSIGDALRDIGGQNVNFGMLSAAYKF